MKDMLDVQEVRVCLKYNFSMRGRGLLLIPMVIGLTSISGLVVDSMNRFLSVTCHFINIYIRLQGFIIIMYSRSQCVAMHFFYI